MNSWISYINSGSLKSELAEKMDSIPESYLSELVSASASDNILVVVCRHYDMEQAVLCMQVVQDITKMRFNISNDNADDIDKLQLKLERSIMQLGSLYDEE